MSALTNLALPELWARAELGSVIEAHYGKSLPAPDRKSVGDVFVMGSSGIVGKHNQSLVEDACIVIGRKGSVGAVYLLTRPSWPIDTTYYVQTTSGLDLHYLYYLLGSMELVRLDKSTAIPGLNRGDLYRVSAPIAPAAEQIRIVEKLEELLSDLDAGVAELKAAQKKLAQYRQSLLKAAVEGALTADWRAARAAANAEPAQAAAPSYPPSFPRRRESSSVIVPETLDPRLRGDDEAQTGSQLLARILTERRSRWQTRQLAKFEAQGKAPPKDWQAKYPEPVAPDTAGLPELPQGWVWASVDQCAVDEKAITDGPFGSYLKSSHYQETGPRVVRLKNIGEGVFVNADAHISPAHFELLGKHAVLEQDLLVAMLGEVLPRACIAPAGLSPAIVKADCARIRINQELISPAILNTALNSKPTRDRVAGLVKGIGRPRINLGHVRSIAIAISSTEEQAQIELALQNGMESIVQQLDAIKFSLKQSAAQRKNILQAAFSGQLVPQDPADEPASALLARIRAERAAHIKLRKPRQTREVS